MRLDHMKIGTKMFLVPGFLLLVILGMALATMFIMSSEKKRLQSLQNETIQQQVSALNLQKAVSQIHGDMYRVLTWNSNGMNYSQVDGLIEKIQTDATQAQKDVLSFNNASLQEKFETYQQAVMSFIKVAGASVYKAMDAIDASDKAYASLTPVLDKMVTESGNRASDDFASAIDLGKQATMIYLVAAFVATLISIVLALFVARKIAGPVGDVANAIEKVAQGELDVTTGDASRKDEVGVLVRSVDLLKNQLDEAEKMRVERRRKDREEKESHAQLLNATETFESSANSILGIFNTTFVQVSEMANTMSDVSEQTSQRATQARQDTDVVSETVQSVSDAAHALSQSIGEIGEQVNQASQIAAKARQRGEESQTVADSLNEASERIGGFVDIIGSVAEQTNLLALNATIEAARAGDAGKGFAVVASEVKSLADQTSKATDQISKLVDDMQGLTTKVQSSSDAMVEVIDEIDHVSTTIAAAVEEQHSATQGISDNVHHASQNIHTIAQNVQMLDQDTDNTRNNSHQVIDATNGLKSQAGELEDAVRTLLSDISQTKQAAE